MSSEWIRNIYGMEPLSLEQEINLPWMVKQTRNNKMKIIDTCGHMTQLLETIKDTARMAPTPNDLEHAQLVQAYTDAVTEAYKAVQRAWSVGESGGAPVKKSIKAVSIADSYGNESLALINTEKSVNDLESEIEDIEEDYDEETDEDDPDPVNKANYVIDTLLERGYELLPYDGINRYYN